eukprot:jgi/Hompol1/6621/HPOL_003615-RA
MHPTLHQIITALLDIQTESRLGSDESDAKSIMNHRWFAGVDWETVLKRGFIPPIRPSFLPPNVIEHTLPDDEQDEVLDDLKVEESATPYDILQLETF